MAFTQLPTLLSEPNLNALFNLIIFNVTQFGLHHLWFLLALIYCFIIYYVLIKLQVKPNTLYKFIPILIIFSLVIGEFLTLFIGEFFGYKSVELSFLTLKYYRNFLFMGLPFFTLGYLIHDKKDILTEKISNSFLIAFGIFWSVINNFRSYSSGKIRSIYRNHHIFSLHFHMVCKKSKYT